MVFETDRVAAALHADSGLERHLFDVGIRIEGRPFGIEAGSARRGWMQALPGAGLGLPVGGDELHLGNELMMGFKA